MHFMSYTVPPFAMTLVPFALCDEGGAGVVPSRSAPTAG
jgi:hypothetical protein